MQLSKQLNQRSLNSMKKLHERQIDQRRSLVAKFTLRGYSQRAIVDVLKEKGITNTRTGRNWALGTISNDSQKLITQWRERASQDIALHKARLLAEIQEIKRVAWKNDDLSLVLNAIKEEVSILGLGKPTTTVDLTSLPQIIYIRSAAYSNNHNNQQIKEN